MDFGLKNGVRNFCNWWDGWKTVVWIANEFVKTYEGKKSRTSGAMIGRKSESMKTKMLWKMAYFEAVWKCMLFERWRFFFISSSKTVSKIFAIYVSHRKRVLWLQTSLWERMKPNKVEQQVLWWPRKVKKSKIRISSKKLDLAWKNMFFDEVRLVGFWA